MNFTASKRASIWISNPSKLSNGLINSSKARNDSLLNTSAMILIAVQRISQYKYQTLCSKYFVLLFLYLFSKLYFQDWMRIREWALYSLKQIRAPQVYCRFQLSRPKTEFWNILKLRKSVFEDSFGCQFYIFLVSFVSIFFGCDIVNLFSYFQNSILK